MHPNARLALAVLLVCAGYYATGIVALVLRLEPGGISTIWLPHGVLLAALMLTPVRAWWLYLAALLPVHLHLVRQFQGPVPLDVMFVQYGGNILQAVLGALAVRRLVGTPPRLDTLRHMTDFIVLGVVLPVLIVSALAAALFVLAGWVGDFRLAWHRRTLTGICGAVALTPLILAVAPGGTAAIRAAPWRRSLEFAALTIGVLALAMPALGGGGDLASQQAPLFAPLPLLLWTAVRFGPGALSVQLLIVTLAALTATKSGYAPFLATSAAESVLSAQAFLLSLSIALLLLSSLVAERNRSARALDERLKFEQLISEVSARLINPPLVKAEEALEKALHKVVNALALDRCSVYQYHPARRSCRITHSAQSADCPVVRREIADVELPWLLRQLQAGVTVVLNEVVRDLPAEAIAERRYAEGYGSRSWVAVPVTVGDDVVRAVSFHSIRQRDWSAELVSRLQLIAEIFVSSVRSLQSKEALQASEKRYRAVVEDQTELICRFLPDGTYTFVNDAYCRYFQCSPEELLGRTFWAFIPAQEHAAAREFLASLTRDHPVATREHEVLVPGGEVRWQQWRDRAFFDDHGRVVEYQAVGRDITERKHTEDAMQGLAHAARLAVMGELTASIAHEINQPLNAILNNADAAELLLEDGSGRLDEVRQILADIRKDDLRASEVIRHARELLRRRDPERRPVDIRELVTGVVRLLGRDADRRQVALEPELAPDLPVVYGDKVQLEQVLLNLVLNGMDAMAGAPVPRRRLAVRVARRAGSVEVAVMDNGPGISATALPRLFESFFTTKKDGMGLGLPLARSIVEAHGGRIWAEGRPEGGAAFRFTLPTGPAA
jgi:PAS domain S-box-containing protein